MVDTPEIARAIQTSVLIQGLNLICNPPTAVCLAIQFGRPLCRRLSLVGVSEGGAVKHSKHTITFLLALCSRSLDFQSMTHHRLYLVLPGVILFLTHMH